MWAVWLERGWMIQTQLHDTYHWKKAVRSETKRAYHGVDRVVVSRQRCPGQGLDLGAARRQTGSGKSCHPSKRGLPGRPGCPSHVERSKSRITFQGQTRFTVRHIYKIDATPSSCFDHYCFDSRAALNLLILRPPSASSSGWIGDSSSCKNPPWRWMKSLRRL